MSSQNAKIIYTITDEAPALATYSFLPIIEAYTKVAGVKVETKDISLASRIITNIRNDHARNTTHSGLWRSPFRTHIRKIEHFNRFFLSICPYFYEKAALYVGIY